MRKHIYSFIILFTVISNDQTLSICIQLFQLEASKICECHHSLYLFLLTDIWIKRYLMADFLKHVIDFSTALFYIYILT